MKVFSRQEVNEIVNRYSRGDEVAGKQVDALVRGRQHDTNESYGTALRNILRPAAIPESIPPTGDDDFFEAANEIEKWTVKLMNDLRVDRRTAIRLACALCSDRYGPAYTGHPVKAMSVEEIYRTYGNNADNRNYSSTDYSTLANIVLAHKLSTGRVDWSAADRAAMLQPATIRKNAAQYWLAALITQSTINVPADHVDRSAIEKKVREQHPELGRMADTGGSSIAALRDLFWQHV